MLFYFGKCSVFFKGVSLRISSSLQVFLSDTCVKIVEGTYCLKLLKKSENMCDVYIIYRLNLPQIKGQIIVLLLLKVDIVFSIGPKDWEYETNSSQIINGESFLGVRLYFKIK